MTTTDLKLSALQQAAASSPEYAEIVPLFIAVYQYARDHQGETGLTVVSAGDRRHRTDQGFPLLTPTDLRVDVPQNLAYLGGLVAVLRSIGQENEQYLQQIGAALALAQLDPFSIYAAILERRRAPLLDLSAALSVPAALLEYIFELPLKTALESFSAGYAADDFTGWQEGFCPVCGSRAGMAELSGEEGRRLLACSACAFQWPFTRIKCAFCGCEEPQKLSYFTAGEGGTRVDTCTGCSRYIKTRDSRKANSDVPLEIEDLLTIHLDLLASREGFERGK